MPFRVLILILPFCGQVAAARPPEAAPVERLRLPPELARVLTDYEAGWKAGDGAALAELFVEDGFVLPNGGPPVRGRAAIRQYYKGPGGPLALYAFAFATEGATGYIIGGFSRQEGQPDVGKFTLTLKKSSDGRWRIVSDMDNGNRPPSPHVGGASLRLPPPASSLGYFGRRRAPQADGSAWRETGVVTAESPSGGDSHRMADG